MPTPKKLHQLCGRFLRNLTAYKQGRYKEAQLRREFIDPFFKLLGWDMDNEKGYAEAYKEVIHEDAIRVGRATKAPDYCFRIGGVRKFFLEAKKPSIDIKGNVNPAYQLRRYAWSAKLPLSILTDFEEFAVYDCRIKPVKTDKASTARIFYLTHREYPQRWDEIAGIFSPEAIRQGSFDKYVEEKKKKRGTAEVDASFLHEIERWRDMLARNIALRNPDLSQRELNFATQRTIDRIIFLRICEDRGIEHYSTLMALQNGTRIYQRLVELFHRADDRYNSGLFNFKPEKERPGESLDTLTTGLAIDDKTLKDIFKNLYYPDSPYEFSVFPADILGQVYEQFLGKVIRLTPGHRAVIEDKPEVRKAGGVYYTPTYIVDYIVKQTVGKLLEGKKPGPRSPVSKLKILDPACGSGSFLLGAYQYLLDWHRDQYIADDPRRWSRGRSPRLYRAGPGERKLTTDERKRILLGNIYGVDIDPQAVEVTKLSLLLKVLEGEDEQTITRQLALFQKRVLPDLGNNIKCGNSLIGPDFWEGRQLALMEDDEMLRINAFDWEVEFAEIMKGGGFDAVIGNPPYGAEFKDTVSNYLKEAYITFVWRGESYLVFVERVLQLLNKGGLLGFIIPDTYLNLGFTKSLRTHLLQNSKLREIVLLPSNVFKGTTVDTTLLFAEKSVSTTEYHKALVNVKVFSKRETITSVIQPIKEFQIDTRSWHEQQAFNVQSDRAEISLVKKIEVGKARLSSIARVFSGIKVYEVGKGSPPQTPKIRETKPFTSEIQVSNQWHPFYDGKHVGRYQLLWNQNNWIYYGPWVAAPRNPQNFDGEKILIRKIVGKTLISTYIPEKSYCNTLLFVFKIYDPLCSYHYMLGIINSALIAWYFRKKFQISPDDTFPQIMMRDVLQFPIPVPPKTIQDKIVVLVRRMLEFQARLAKANTPQAKTTLKRQIEATDRQIDQLVYELYGLTEKEIKIVEESLR